MVKPNTSFNLSIRDVKVIEESLQKQVNRLCESRRTAIESTIQPPENIQTVIEADKRIKEIQDLLGRLHNQKNWYRPEEGIYVSG